MTQPERRNLIRSHLGIEPISHGQVYTFQIAVPESEKKDIFPERHQILEDSLTEHKTNLVPLIVRRTQDYSDEEEYEVIYGADWCLVAKELDIEKLWVWVYDMTDEQSAAAKAEMEQLTGSTSFEITETPPVSDEIQQIKHLLQGFEQSFQNKLDSLNRQLNQTSMSSGEKSSVSSELFVSEKSLEQLEQLIERKLKPVKSAVEVLKKELEAIGSDINKQTPGFNFESSTEAILENKTVAELKLMAKKRKIPRYSSMKKIQLIAALKETGTS